MFTNLGAILISVNPYFNLPDLFNDSLIEEYRKNPETQAPHVYAIRNWFFLSENIKY